MKQTVSSISRRVRDLIWAVHSHSLITDGMDVSQVDPAQIDPKHLAAFVNEAPSHRVGRYFERLILYWLKHIRRLEIVAESMPIRDANRTIGEIDLLFRDENRQLTHWEVAVKFYLHFPQDNPIGSHYIGPNAADTFERKMERLFGHQLPLSETYFPDVKVRQAFVKGRIFYHPQQVSSPDLPSRLSADHLRGVWIRSSELDYLSRSDGVSYKILHKPHWIADEVTDTTDTDLLSPAELIENMVQHFAQDNRPVLIGRLKIDGRKVVEIDRIFVVSDGWPDMERT